MDDKITTGMIVSKDVTVEEFLDVVGFTARTGDYDGDAETRYFRALVEEHASLHAVVYNYANDCEVVETDTSYIILD